MENKNEGYIIKNKKGEYYSGWLDSYTYSSWVSGLLYVGDLVTFMNDIEIYNSIEIAKEIVDSIAECEKQDVDDYKILKLKIEISEIDND